VSGIQGAEANDLTPGQLLNVQMGKSKKNFAEFIVAPADASSFGGTYRAGEGFGQTSVYFKRKSPELPYRVANEYICSRLGQFIGLPVPPHGFDADWSNASIASLSWILIPRESSLFPINPAACVLSDPRLCTGILLF